MPGGGTLITAWSFDATNAVPYYGAGSVAVLAGTVSYFNGNPSTGKAMSTTTWGIVGSQYVEFCASTVGFTSIRCISDLYISSTGPPSVIWSYSATGSGGAYTNTGTSSGTLVSAIWSFPYASGVWPADAENAPNFCCRLTG